MSELTLAAVKKLLELERRLDDLTRPEIQRGPTFLDAPLTSVNWDGDAYSTTAKTLIDLSAEFGVPAGVKAVLVDVVCRDSGSDGSTTFYGVILSPNNVASQGPACACNGLTNDAQGRNMMVVPCDSNGDIYYQIAASGAGTLDVWLRIWGYWAG